MAIPSSTPIPKTVFVVGAGASQEAQLTKAIAKVLDIRFEHGYRQISGDDRIAEALRVAAGSSDPPSRDINPFLHAGWRIRDAMPQAISIDNFIDSHSGDKQIELCGKLAIVRTILQAEAESSLFVEFQGNDRLKFGQLENTWFHSFVQRLTENCKSSDLATRLNSIALVIFNYDRCIEHYLYHAIQNYYAMSASDVAQLLQRLEIYHPYGVVGTLPWRGTDNAIEFGDTPHSKQLVGLAKQIKTFAEGTDELASDVMSIRSIMKTSHKLVFLGFAFHQLNIDLLLPTATSKGPPTGRRVFATARGISRSDTDSISTQLADRGELFEGNIQIRNDLTCSQLFREYWRSLSFV
jgi:hypothetical protein